VIRRANQEAGVASRLISIRGPAIACIGSGEATPASTVTFSTAGGSSLQPKGGWYAV
jgi:hypothetical protein